MAADGRSERTLIIPNSASMTAATITVPAGVNFFGVDGLDTKILL